MAEAKKAATRRKTPLERAIAKLWSDADERAVELIYAGFRDAGMGSPADFLAGFDAEGARTIINDALMNAASEAAKGKNVSAHSVVGAWRAENGFDVYDLWGAVSAL